MVLLPHLSEVDCKQLRFTLGRGWAEKSRFFCQTSQSHFPFKYMTYTLKKSHFIMPFFPLCTLTCTFYSYCVIKPQKFCIPHKSGAGLLFTTTSSSLLQDTVTGIQIITTKIVKSRQFNFFEFWSRIRDHMTLILLVWVFLCFFFSSKSCWTSWFQTDIWMSYMAWQWKQIKMEITEGKSQKHFKW